MNAGHNSDPSNKNREYVRRFKTLLEEQAENASELRDLAKEAKSHGVDPKVARFIAKDELDPDRRKRREAFQDEVDQTRAVMGAL